MNLIKKSLIDARQILSDPKRWTKCTFARNAAELRTSSTAPDAVSFCALGACHRAAYQNRVTAASVYGALIDVTPFACGTTDRHVPHFNDHPDRTHEEILELFDKAIEAQPE